MVGVVVVEAVEGGHMAGIHRRGRGARYGGIRAIGVAIGRALRRATMAERRRAVLRSGLVEDIGIEEGLVVVIVVSDAHDRGEIGHAIDD